jgi:ribosomal-protein-alanine N-acetyltransferase
VETVTAGAGSGSGFRIRHARREDIPAVIVINRVALPENYPEWFFEDHLSRWGDAFYVAEADGRIVGYVMSRVEYGSSNFDVRRLVRKGHIVSIAVLPGYRRRGIGTALMKAALRSLRETYGCEEVYLEVRVSNTPAIRLYEKLGFRRVRVIPMYYLDGEDAYVMAKPLSGDEE